MADHNFATQGPKAYFNPKTGESTWCHSKEDVDRAKSAGFTSANYVRSEWPKTAFHKKTGETRVVGKLDATKEQNDAAVAGLGEDWGLDHVATPEPVATKKALDTATDLSAIVAALAEGAETKKRIADMETVIESLLDTKSEGDSVRAALERRIAELEETTPAPFDPKPLLAEVAKLQKQVAELAGKPKPVATEDPGKVAQPATK